MRDDRIESYKILKGIDIVDADDSSTSSESTSEDTNPTSTMSEEATHASLQIPLTLEEPNREEGENKQNHASLRGTCTESNGQMEPLEPYVEHYAHGSRDTHYNLLEIPRQPGAKIVPRILCTENVRDALQSGFLQLHSDLTTLQHSTQSGWGQLSQQIAVFANLLNQITKYQSPSCSELEAATSQSSVEVPVSQVSDNSDTAVDFVIIHAENDSMETLASDRFT
ncbi:uncharacterized protein [Heterodontus francisci]|uniref:uncharacterized protein isoform X1 n=1 Tax=Heterodontus francisci TaxID=7792 RepID=UPI00355B9A3D